MVSIILDSNSVSQPGSTINSLTENIPGVIYKIFYRHTVFHPSLDPSPQSRVTAPPGLAMTFIISNNTDLARMYIVHIPASIFLHKLLSPCHHLGQVDCPAVIEPVLLTSPRTLVCCCCIMLLHLIRIQV